MAHNIKSENLRKSPLRVLAHVLDYCCILAFDPAKNAIPR